MTLTKSGLDGAAHRRAQSDMAVDHVEKRGAVRYVIDCAAVGEAPKQLGGWLVIRLDEASQRQNPRGESRQGRGEMARVQSSRSEHVTYLPSDPSVSSTRTMSAMRRTPSIVRST